MFCCDTKVKLLLRQSFVRPILETRKMSRERGREEGTKGGESEEHKIFFMVLFPRETDGRTDGRPDGGRTFAPFLLLVDHLGVFFSQLTGENGGEGEGMGEMGARDEGEETVESPL